MSIASITRDEMMSEANWTSISVKQHVDNDVLYSMIVHVFEDFGYGSFEIVDYVGDIPVVRDELISDFNVPGYVVASLTKGCSVLVKDKYGDEPDVYEFNIEAIVRGLQVMADKYPHHFNNVMADNTDVITSDVLAQCAIFGEIVYG